MKVRNFLMDCVILVSIIGLLTFVAIWLVRSIVSAVPLLSEKINAVIPNDKGADSDAKFRVGDKIVFGSYEQDDDLSNGKEPIEWLVLDKEGERLLVISRFVLDGKVYHEGEDNATWENCTLRRWLNEDFINAAFTVEEQMLIPTVTVEGDVVKKYETDPGNATQDKIFLLSINEAYKYFSSNQERLCKPTAYAKHYALWEINSGNVLWTLRTPGPYPAFAAMVNIGGYPRVYDADYSGDESGIRPVMWIYADGIDGYSY